MNIKPGDKLIALYSANKKAIGFIAESCALAMVDARGERLTELQSIVTGDGEE